jgi:phospholipid-binding lipoprotein MlaA
MTAVQRLLPVLLLSVVLLSACAGGGVRQDSSADMAAEDETYDPFEPFNRAMFAFNEKFDQWLLKPVAKGYDFVLPGVVKQGIGNFFSNLVQPRVAVNDLLQGKLAQSGRDTGRFLVNTTVGVVGLFDVATSLGLEARDEDWGQTFAVWGAGDGPYFVWPIIGPHNLRDTFGFGFDWLSTPVTYVQDPGTQWSLWGVDTVDTRARLLPAERVLEQAVTTDKYTFIREAYQQRRRNLIYDGNPPRPKFFEDDSEPPAKPAVPADKAQ